MAGGVTCFSHFRLFCWKNWVQKRRAPCSTACELLTAPLLVSLFALLYHYVPLLDIPATTYECAGSSLDSGSTDFAYLSRQLSASRRVLGVVAPPALRGAFTAHLEATYPGMTEAALAPLNCLLLAAEFNASGTPPFFPPLNASLVRGFDSEAALEAYVLADGYGKSDSAPGLQMAVVFQSGGAPGGGEWAYRLRGNFSDAPDVRRLGDPLQLGPNLGVISAYLQSAFSAPGAAFSTPGPGLVPLQLAVDRFILGARAGNASQAAAGALADAGLFALQWGCTGADPLALAEVGGSLLRSHGLLPQRARVAPFPTAPYRLTNFYAFVGAVFSFMFVVSFLFPSFFMIRCIVMEKESKLREGMRMMGMADVAITGAWYATYGVVFALISAAVALTVKASFFPRSDGGLLFILFLLFGLSSTALCFLISVFFSHAKTASGIGALLFFAMFFPYFKVSGPLVAGALKSAGCLSASVAFGLALDIVSTLESANRALTWGGLADTVNGFTVGEALRWMLGDAALYTALALYLLETLPQEYGVPQAWHFPLSPAYWAPLAYGPPGRSLRSAWRALLRGERNAAAGGAEAGAALLGGGGGGDAPWAAPAEGACVEPPSKGNLDKGRAGRSVAVRGLRKEFSTPEGVKAAVDGIDLDLYEGEIFALLGHNGAGKSTAISVLTGLVPPTAGDAWMHGLSIKTDLAAIRQTMGVCPQHDVLWPDLTVEEHLLFFGAMKGVGAGALREAVRKVVREVGLEDAVLRLSKDLSGGMKRKLSVAIALIGDPKVVFLDEPTSGMVCSASRPSRAPPNGAHKRAP
jgi:ATP-binding cassette subfamily A (ABC1) protein 3